MSQTRELCRELLFACWVLSVVVVGTVVVATTVLVSESDSERSASQIGSNNELSRGLTND